MARSLRDVYHTQAMGISRNSKQVFYFAPPASLPPFFFFFFFFAALVPSSGGAASAAASAAGAGAVGGSFGGAFGGAFGFSSPAPFLPFLPFLAPFFCAASNLRFASRTRFVVAHMRWIDATTADRLGSSSHAGSGRARS